MPPLVVDAVVVVAAVAVAVEGPVAAAVVAADVGAGAARATPASNDKMSAVRKEKPARRTKP